MRSQEGSQESDYTKHGHEESGGVGGVARGRGRYGVRRRLMSLTVCCVSPPLRAIRQTERTRTLSDDCEMVEKKYMSNKPGNQLAI